LDLHYLIGTDTDHVAKFCGDWPRELGDPMAEINKKNITTKKHKAFRNYLPFRVA